MMSPSLRAHTVATLSFMRRWTTLAGIGLALVLCAPAAAATPQDATSTHVFLTAAKRFLLTTIVRRHQEAASVGALAAHVASTCPHAIPGSIRTGTPAQQATGEHFDIASEGEVIVAEIDPLRSAYASFTRAIVHLQWSDQDLNRRIAVAVRQAQAVAALRGPDLCREVSLARASGFRQTPPGIRAFVRRFAVATSSESSTTGELEQLMKPLAGPGDLALFSQVHQLQARTNRIISRVVLGGAATLARELYG